MTLERKPKVFISYLRSDRSRVRELYSELCTAGFEPWFDEMNVLPGEDWYRVLSRAISESDFVLICLSKESVNAKGFVQRELRFALEIALERPSDIFIIPVKLEECEVPRSLWSYQSVELYEEYGLYRLISSIRAGIDRRASKHLALESRYNISNVRALLEDEISVEALRHLIYNVPKAREFLHDVYVSANKQELIDFVIKGGLQAGMLDGLLDVIRISEPDKYKAHQPYFRYSYEYQERAQDQMPLGNPYVVGNPIQPKNMEVFQGRFDIATSIISEIRRDTQRPSLLLYGRRRMGKTSALLNISNLIKDPTLINVYISGQSVKFHSDVTFCFYLVQAINEKLQEHSIDTSVFLKEGFLTQERYQNNPVLSLSEFFDECEALLEELRLYCLLCVDEYEEIDSHISTDQIHQPAEFVSRDLLLEFRDTLQHKPRITFLFAGTHFLRDLSKVDWSSIFINVKTLHVSFLSREDSILLLTQPVPEMRYEDPQLLDQIIYLTGCQPFLLQAVASELVSVLNLWGARTVNQDALDQAINKVITKHNTYFDFIWDKECSTSRHRQVLKRVMKSPKGVQQKLLGRYEIELRDLVRKEILKVEMGTVRVSMPILKFWLKQNQYILAH